MNIKTVHAIQKIVDNKVAYKFIKSQSKRLIKEMFKKLEKENKNIFDKLVNAGVNAEQLLSGEINDLLKEMSDKNAAAKIIVYIFIKNGPLINEVFKNMLNAKKLISLLNNFAIKSTIQSALKTLEIEGVDSDGIINYVCEQIQYYIDNGIGEILNITRSAIGNKLQINDIDNITLDMIDSNVITELITENPILGVFIYGLKGVVHSILELFSENYFAGLNENKLYGGGFKLVINLLLYGLIISIVCLILKILYQIYNPKKCMCDVD